MQTPNSRVEQPHPTESESAKNSFPEVPPTTENPLSISQDGDTDMTSRLAVLRQRTAEKLPNNEPSSIKPVTTTLLDNENIPAESARDLVLKYGVDSKVPPPDAIEDLLNRAA